MELSRELVLLCEGADDQYFFSQMMRRPSLPSFDIPFPTDRLHGNGAYGEMLKAIQGAGIAFNSVRGVLIVADSTDNPSAVFGSIRRQVQSAGSFPLPANPTEIALGNREFPAIQIMLLPDHNKAGCLETLYVEELERTNQGVKACVEEFLGCGPITARAWPSEKADKARFHALVAALHKRDPGKTASRVFDGPSPLLSIAANVFTPIGRRLSSFDAGARRI
jgi:hypothetical protein